MSLFSSASSSASRVLPGRDVPIKTSDVHTISGHSLHPPFPDGHEEIVLGMGCFWGVERLFWQLPGVYVTVVKPPTRRMKRPARAVPAIRKS